MFTFTKFTLARQFMLASLLILLAGMLIIGFWVGEQIETGVINRTAAITSLYMESFISPPLQDLSHSDSLDAGHVAELDRLLSETPLGQQIVAFKVWSLDGHILYSPNPNLIGRQFAIHDHLARALAGEVDSDISNLGELEHEYETKVWDKLIETYAPIRAEGSGEVIAVAEFYQVPDDLKAEIRAAQLRSWLIVGAATLMMYLLLAGMVGRASHTIQVQQTELRGTVTQLRTLLTQNEQLHDRVRRAAARTTALNERFLRRISADLHDGPGQDLSLALLRIESLVESCGHCPVPVSEGRAVADDFRTVQTALESALADLRSIAAGLRLPEIGPLSPAETVRRAIRDYERKTHRSVALTLGDLPAEVPLPVKISLYRILQEALSNGYRHAGGDGQAVLVGLEGGKLYVEVADAGEGFDPTAIPTDGHLGLIGMRERVEMLSGTFEIASINGGGTVVRARLPWHPLEDQSAQPG